MKKNILNLAFYQVGWFAAVLGAAHAAAWLGPLVIVVLLSIHLASVSSRRSEVFTLLAVGGFGFVMDTILIGLEVLKPVSGWIGVEWLCPPWLLAIWFLFGSTLNVSLSWLKGHPVMAGFLGVIGGPLAYWAGQRLGAVEFGESLPVTLAILAVVWAIVTPTLFELANLLHQRSPDMQMNKDLNET